MIAQMGIGKMVRIVKYADSVTGMDCVIKQMDIA
jgi:hypothetical protein